MKKKETKVTAIYSFQVTMRVHVIADSSTEARTQLDDKGGIVTAREVELLNEAPLYGEKESD